MIADVAVWLAKTVGGDQLKTLLQRRGLKAELRSLKKALIESQQRREELEGVAALLLKLHRERDALQAELARLRIEAAELRVGRRRR